jgi:outer membrane lipoprotein SlyB
MKRTILKLSLAATLLAGSAATALAQGYVDPADQARYQQQLQNYQDRQTQYQYDQRSYQDRKDASDAQWRNYEDRRASWAANRDEYLRERADYDARYGAGAWERGYEWRDGHIYRRTSDEWRRDYANSPCERNSSSGTVAGGVIGAIAGAALGSNLAGRGDRTTGGVIGGVAGAALGATVGSSIARSHGPAHCDNTGYYFTYDQTMPMRLASNGGYRYGYDYYRRNGCRMAVAPATYDGQTDYRYVRVCPDRRGRFRITP